MKRYHFASKVDAAGHVSALCSPRPRPINLRRASWTLRPEAVTCEKCLRLLRARDQAADAKGAGA